MMNTDSPGSSKLRILIFNWRDLAHPLAGGAEVYTHRVAEEWIKMGHEVTLFCASVAGKSEIEDLNGLKIIRRGGKHSVYRKAKKFYKQEGRGNFDLIIDEVNTRPFGAPKWVKDAQVIALIHQVCREIWFYQTPFPIAVIGRFFLEPLWLRRYQNNLVITLSESSKKSLENYGLRKVVVVNVGFEVDRYEKKIIKEINPTIIFVGRLSKNKRPLDVIKAFTELSKRVPNAKLWIVGSGELSHKIIENLPKGALFFGRLSDLERDNLIARAHVLVVTSVREGWGLVVTEADALGTTAIGYSVPGLQDSIQAAEGVLCDPTPLALNEALVVFLNKTEIIRNPSRPPKGVKPWSHVAADILNEVHSAN